jgi:hypothetical protein
VKEDTKAFIGAIVLAAVCGGAASIPGWRILSQSPYAADGRTNFVQSVYFPHGHQRSTNQRIPHFADGENNQQLPEPIKEGGLDWPGWIQAISAIFSAIVAIALWLLTRNQVKILNRQTGIMDRQASLTEQALTIAQWPYYYIDQQRFITPISQPAASTVVQFTYRATVHGASPAMIRAVYGQLIFDKSVPASPPRKVIWRVSHGVQQAGFVLDETIRWEGSEIIFSPQERATARAAGKWLYAIGCIVYDDLFGNQHEFCFCYRGAIGGGWGMRAGGDAYNYHRLRSDDERVEIDSLAIPRPNEPSEPPTPLVAGMDFPA